MITFSSCVSSSFHQTCVFGHDCEFDFPYNSDACVNLFYPAPHNTNPEYEGDCVVLSVTGWDQWYSLVFFAVTATAVLLIVALNAAVMVLASYLRRTSQVDTQMETIPATTYTVLDDSQESMDF